MIHTKRLFRFLLAVLMFAQIISALPVDMGPLLSALWFLWIIMGSYFAIIICTERRSLKNNSFALLLLFFWLINAISFYISPKYVQSFFVEVDTLVIIKSITIALFAYFPFYYYSKKGVIDNNNLKVFVILLFVTSVMNIFYGSIIQSKETLEKNNILNQAYLFVQLIPLFMIYFKRTVLYTLVALSIILVLWSSKRGAILCVTVELLVLLIYLLREDPYGKKHRGAILFLSFVLLLGVFYFIQGNVFLQDRLINTGTDYDKSGDIRSERYLMLYTVFFNFSSVGEILFGHGFAQTVSLGGGLAHQDWAELLIDNGLLGFIIYIVLISICIKNIFKHNKIISKDVKYALVCCITNWLLMATYSMVYTSRVAFVMFLTIGVINGLMQKEKGTAFIQHSHLKQIKYD